MSTPVRLHKKVSRTEEMEAWILSHAYIFVPLLLVLMVIMFVVVAYALIGVSATESGVTYNHFQDVI